MSGERQADEERLRERVRSISEPGLTLEESQRAYADWAPSYERDMLQCGYSAHLAVCQKVCDKFPPETRAHVRILDVGAGTGLAAKEMRKHGFVHIDGLEPHETMLNAARKQNLYENYFQTFITGEPLDIEKGLYDAITGSGIFGKECHVPAEALVEMIRLVKPGGIITLATREELLQATETMTEVASMMQKLEADGKWKCIAREIWPRYYMNVNGIVWCYEVL